MSLLYLADLFGIIVFAISGALMAGRKSMDLFGVLVIAVITALGGGTVRDVILDNHPIGWMRDQSYLVLAIVAALGTVAWSRLVRPIRERGLLVADAFGLAVFTVAGTDIALQHGAPVFSSLLMGVMTGVAGGVIRDMLCNEIPLIFHREIYATACLLGALVFVGLRQFALPVGVDTALGMLVVLGVRMAAIRWQLALPRFQIVEREER